MAVIAVIMYNVSCKKYLVMQVIFPHSKYNNRGEDQQSNVMTKPAFAHAKTKAHAPYLFI